MEKTRAEIESSIQSKLDSDTTFQSEIANLSEEEKSTKINERKAQEFDRILEERLSKAEKAEELAGNYKTRAEKAEAAAREAKKKEVSESGESTLSTKDTLALINAKISPEDFDEVVRLSKIINKPIMEALNDKTVKSILSDRMEERQTAAATNTRGGARGTATVSPEALLANAEQGIVPDESDSEGIANLAKARMERNKRKK